MVIHMKVYEGKAKKMIPLDEGKLIMLNAQISAHIFKLLEEKGIKTHFIGVAGDNRLIVEKLQMYPVEVVVRNIVAGSLKKRLPLEEGTELEEPIIELYYKNDALGDPMINYYHAKILGVDESEIKEMEKIAFKVNEILKEYFKEKGILLVDFKLEFGKNEKGEIVLADEISPDTCRFWDVETKKSLDKDVFRFDKGDLISAYEEIYKRIIS